MVTVAEQLRIQLLKVLSGEKLLWDKSEVAERLGITPDGVENLHRCRLLVAVKVGKHSRWKPQDVRQYVDGLQPTNGKDR